MYLNGDFGGGALVFPELDISVRPTAGMLVLFLSELIHETEPVKGETRYCLVGFAETQLAS
jgi:predicted 2-oxoglutarate/Fe(II)-dependent dioxygenase YbiX